MTHLTRQKVGMLVVGGRPMNLAILMLGAAIAVVSCGKAAVRNDGGSGSGGGGGAASGGASGGVTGQSDARSDAGEPRSDASVDGDAQHEDASSEIADAADAAASLEPIRVFGGTADAGASYHDLRFVGSGFEQYEGVAVTFRIGEPTSIWRLGSGQVRIAQGGFDVLFSGVLEPTYKRKLFHIDADGSGGCDAGEPVYIDQGLFQADTTLAVTPSDIRFRPATTTFCDMIRDWPAP
jgi:hypothetical protein